MNMAALQSAMEHAGVAGAAISGVLAARGKEVDLFGALVLALATSFGGGTVRDLLAGEVQVGWLRHPELIWNALVTGLVTFFAARWIRMPEGVLLGADALSLAFFVMLGTAKGLALELSAVVAVMFGVMAGVAGGIVRDVLLGEVPAVFRREIRLYATAAIVGGSVCVMLQPWGPMWAAGVGFFVVLSLRLAAMRWDLTLPVFKTKDEI